MVRFGFCLRETFQSHIKTDNILYNKLFGVRILESLGYRTVLFS